MATSTAFARNVPVSALLRLPLGNLLQFLLHFICVMCSSSLLGDFLWVRWWLRVQWFGLGFYRLMHFLVLCFVF